MKAAAAGTAAWAGSGGATQGPFQPKNHEVVERRLREGIDLAVRVNCKNVITFTGMREPGISDEQGARNCVDCCESS